MVIVQFLDNRGGQVFTSESLLFYSSVTVTLTFYCLVPNAKDKAKKKKAIKEVANNFCSLKTLPGFSEKQKNIF